MDVQMAGMRVPRYLQTDLFFRGVFDLQRLVGDENPCAAAGRAPQCFFQLGGMAQVRDPDQIERFVARRAVRRARHRRAIVVKWDNALLLPKLFPPGAAATVQIFMVPSGKENAKLGLQIPGDWVQGWAHVGRWTIRHVSG